MSEFLGRRGQVGVRLLPLIEEVPEVGRVVEAVREAVGDRLELPAAPISLRTCSGGTPSIALVHFTTCCAVSQ